MIESLQSEWRIRESNPWPPACKAGALANWANSPCKRVQRYKNPQYSNTLNKKKVKESAKRQVVVLWLLCLHKKSQYGKMQWAQPLPSFTFFYCSLIFLLFINIGDQISFLPSERGITATWNGAVIPTKRRKYFFCRARGESRRHEMEP